MARLLYPPLTGRRSLALARFSNHGPVAMLSRMRLVLVQPQLGFSSGSENFAKVRHALEHALIQPARDDVLLLPERIHPSHSVDEYGRDVRSLAMELGCVVVGGSQHEARGERVLNAGIAVDAQGSLLGTYEKIRPYALERERVSPGNGPGELLIGGRRFLTLVCADFWFSDLFTRAERLPDVILVPALSVSRKSKPDYSRAMWQHLSISRAYEFGAFVGVSDWGFPSELPMLAASGVAGFANPSLVEPARLFQALGSSEAMAFDLDFDALEAFRTDRKLRGFFWQPGGA
jgi:predicted amidohydrolase